MNSGFFSRLSTALSIIFSRKKFVQLLQPQASPSTEPVSFQAPEGSSALQLIALLQRDGRLLDFIHDDVTAYDDAQVGAAARVVHAGLKKALLEHFSFAPIDERSEGTHITIPSDADPRAYSRVGAAQASAGILVHKGWRVTAQKLPQTTPGYDFSLIAPAEVDA